ncbi:molybdate ABC transporter substrate-binding protein [Phenylobacterium aquaticum]|uniref:molybdate ABC transporter substrate-binding protein n=1 Tax=Phenylobacterium aquaticum TaxID=1763816 RepID=UPI001F5C6B34|nr:molybdate ABC transporter substrate-binding protein [Phenylobacterium aquaticum]MCI3132031.1 molybdate ABC transporter substrate-binding protein [Phenylobacterium aquaticum]
MTSRRAMLAALVGGFAALATAAQALAAETRIAVAANFTEPAKEIAAKFEARTGHKASLSFGSSGQFYAQIANGAPFEVFLSADVERPQKAEADGLAVPGTRFSYATGRLVLWSRTPGLVDAKGAVLAKGGFQKIAIADPKAAPYGLAAVETLKKLGLYDQLTPKLVTGTSITQTYQFIDTGAAELGFVALSQVVNRPDGSRWLVPVADHTPIDQQAVLLKTGADNPAAKAFLQFLKGPEAKTTIRRYGYEVR